MNIETKKVRLIERITRVDDPAIIDQINAILEHDEGDFYDELTNKQRISAQKGLSQVESGNTVPHKEVKKLYQQWL